MKVYLAEIFLNSLPQNFALVLGIYAFNKQKIIIRKFWTCMAVSLAAIFLIRLLPISFGIPTLLSMIVMILLGVYYLGFPINRTIMSVFLSFILTLILEIINVAVLTFFYGNDGFDAIRADPLKNAIAGFPASTMLFVVIFILYLIFTRHIKRGDDDGETGQSDI